MSALRRRIAKVSDTLPSAPAASARLRHPLMGHQYHFLSRLDRVGMPEVELALALYRDHDLVRFLLGQLTLPEGSGRVAVSLADPVRGPFLIVTREGRFVTCLAEGMKPGRLPVVTRQRLDAIAAKHGHLRARIAALRALTGRENGTRELLLRLYHAGDEVSREDIVAASALTPLLGPELLRMLVDLGRDLVSARAGVYEVLRRTDKPRAVWRGLLEAYWKSFHCSAHLTVLIATNGRALLERAEDARRKLGRFFTIGLFEHAEVASAIKAVWSVAKLGRNLLPNYKDAYAGAECAMEVIESAAALAAIGHRHVQTRAEVRKALAALPHRFGRDPAHAAPRAFSEGIVKLSEKIFEDPETARRAQRYHGAQIAVAVGEGRSLGDPYRYEREEDVPEALAMSLAVNSGDTFLRKLSNVGSVFCALPWSARAKPEDLYLPADFLRALRGPWTSERTLGLFRETAEVRKTGRRKPAEAGPARNGPCPCGSGKKYKRCCAEVD